MKLEGWVGSGIYSLYYLVGVFLSFKKKRLKLEQKRPSPFSPKNYQSNSFMKISESCHNPYDYKFDDLLWNYIMNFIGFNFLSMK